MLKLESAEYDIQFLLLLLTVFGRFFMDPDILADPEPDSGNKVLSRSRQKDPDPKHGFS